MIKKTLLSLAVIKSTLVFAAELPEDEGMSLINARVQTIHQQICHNFEILDELSINCKKQLKFGGGCIILPNGHGRAIKETAELFDIYPVCKF